MTDPWRPCRSCGAPVRWYVTENGRRMPVNTAPVNPVLAAAGMVAVNPARGTCRVLGRDAIDSGDLQRWTRAGATLHTAHWATCPNANHHRTTTTQESMI